MPISILLQSTPLVSNAAGEQQGNDPERGSDA
jgi:hypothetical protein